MPTVYCVTLNSFRYFFLHWLQNCTMVNKCLKWRFRLSSDLLKSESSKWTVERLGRDITWYQTIKCEGVYGSSTFALDTYVGHKGFELRPTFTFVITVRSSQHVRVELFQWPFGLFSRKLCPTKVLSLIWTPVSVANLFQNRSSEHLLKYLGCCCEGLTIIAHNPSRYSSPGGKPLQSPNITISIQVFHRIRM